MQWRVKGKKGSTFATKGAKASEGTKMEKRDQRVCTRRTRPVMSQPLIYLKVQSLLRLSRLIILPFARMTNGFNAEAYVQGHCTAIRSVHKTICRFIIDRASFLFCILKSISTFDKQYLRLNDSLHVPSTQVIQAQKLCTSSQK